MSRRFSLLSKSMSISSHSTEKERSRARAALHDAEERMYAFEKAPNFRFVSKLLATASSDHLTSKDLASPNVVEKLSALGEFAEIAHGSISPKFVFEHRKELAKEPEYPLDGYGAILDEQCSLVDSVIGSVGDLQAFVALRRAQSEIVVSFSGTSNAVLAGFDIMTNKHHFRHYCPPPPGTTVTSRKKLPPLTGKVHAGFYRVYKGVREQVYHAFREGIEQMKKEQPEKKFTIVLTGHSLGAVVAYMFFLDLIYLQLHPTQEPGYDFPSIPQGTHFLVAAFGPPRVGDPTLIEYLRGLVQEYKEKFGEDSVEDYMVLAHRDGVPDLPPRSLGFQHFSTNRYYLFQGALYHIPPPTNATSPISPTAEEYTFYHVDTPDQEETIQREIIWLRGGHNYYNGRDMERLQRRLKAIAEDFEKGVKDWEVGYLKREKEELEGFEKRWKWTKRMREKEEENKREKERKSLDGNDSTHLRRTSSA